MSSTSKPHEEPHQTRWQIQPWDTWHWAGIFIGCLECFIEFNLLPQHWESTCAHGYFMAQPTRALKGDSRERAEHHQVDHHQEHTAAGAITCLPLEAPKGRHLNRASWLFGVALSSNDFTHCELWPMTRLWNQFNGLQTAFFFKK